jgi:hypothetical protein
MPRGSRPAQAALRRRRRVALVDSTPFWVGMERWRAHTGHESDHSSAPFSYIGLRGIPDARPRSASETAVVRCGGESFARRADPQERVSFGPYNSWTEIRR